jgi:hypothetical protein
MLLHPDSTKPPGVLPPEFVSGFGTLMGEERELRAVVRGAIAQIQGGQALNLIDILRHHDQQIGSIIHLIERREDQLPQAARFQAFPSSTAWHALRQPSPDEADSGPLWPIIDGHLRLLHAIQALIIAGKRCPTGEPLLDRAARRHEEMAWRLTALQTDEDGELPPSRPSSAPAK